MMAVGIKGTSSMRIHRDLKMTQSCAWHLMQRIREVFTGIPAEPIPGPVEVDETYLGGKARNKHASKKHVTITGPEEKTAVVGMWGKPQSLERVTVTGEQSRLLIRSATHKDITQFVHTHISQGSTLYTDDGSGYRKLEGYTRIAVNHSAGEYVRDQANTNGIEGFWALLKRSYIGTFHHFSVKHLSRYLHEFEARYNMRTMKGGARLNLFLESIPGTRLTYDRLIG